MTMYSKPVFLPLALVLGFLLVLFADAAMLVAADALTDQTISVSSFGTALLAALVAAAVSIAIEVVIGTNDDDTYTLSESDVREVTNSRVVVREM